MITLYHGSNIVIDAIDLSKGMKDKDFGKGFYLTALEMALRFGDKLQMLTLVAGGNDEVLHFLIGNG